MKQFLPTILNLNTMILIIYLIGVILAFIMGRIQRKKTEEELVWNTWTDIVFSLLCSLFSWLLVIIILTENMKNISKPPKWL